MSIGLFAGMNKAVRAMQTAQYSLGVHSSNIAHANDPNYTRRDVVPNSPTKLGGPAVLRMRDAFVDEQFRRAAGNLGEAEARQNVLGKIEAIFGDPVDGGLRRATDQFFDAWKGLAENPPDGVARLQVLAAAKSFAQQIGATHAQLSSVEQTINEQLVTQVGEVNEALQQVFDLNKRIAELRRSNMDHADLTDRRDEVLDQLARLTGAVSIEQPDGSVRVVVGATAVVDGPTVIKLQLEGTPQGPKPVWDVFWKQPLDAAGSLAGLVRVRDGELAQLKSEIDNLGKTVARQVNDLHGQPPIFSIGPAQGDVAVSATITAADIKAGDSGDPGDGTIARQMAQLGEAPILESVIIPGQFQPARMYYRNLVGWIGARAQDAISTGEVAKTHLKMSEQQRQSAHGVSLDEEAAYLTLQQKAFQAAARVISVMDDMMDHLINRTAR